MDRREELNLLRSKFEQGAVGMDAEHCEKCGRSVSGRQQWWKLTPAENDFRCFCRPCALFIAHIFMDNSTDG